MKAFAKTGLTFEVANPRVDLIETTLTLIDKVPGFSANLLDTSSTYPRVGAVRCEQLARWRDATGRDLVRITIALPDGIESTEEVSEFVVLSTQLT